MSRKNYFYGEQKGKCYFEGWYFKHENGSQTICFIPSFHIDQRGQRSAMLQVIANDHVWKIHYAPEQFYAAKGRLYCRIGRNVFSENGISIDIRTRELKMKGNLSYGKFAELQRDIMGPFRRMPFLQCRHEIISMRHRVAGTLKLNREKIHFGKGSGYIEKDRGTSFPDRYVWTQCSRGAGGRLNLMAAAATIPVGPFSFEGTIAEIWFGRRKYRLATYCGARVKESTEKRMVIEQKNIKFEAQLQEKNPQKLLAPQSGAMGRNIYEHAACTVRYRLFENGEVIFNEICTPAGFEADIRGQKRGEDPIQKTDYKDTERRLKRWKNRFRKLWSITQKKERRFHRRISSICCGRSRR